MKKSQYIPAPKPVKPSLWSRIKERILFSFYVGKVKVQFDQQGGSVWRVGFTVYPQYSQFELNFGKYLLNFWYRKDMVK